MGNINPFPVFRPGCGATAAPRHFPYDHRTIRQVDLDEEMREAMARDRKSDLRRAKGKCAHGVLHSRWCGKCFAEDADITDRLKSGDF